MQSNTMRPRNLVDTTLSFFEKVQCVWLIRHRFGVTEFIIQRGVRHRRKRSYPTSLFYREAKGKIIEIATNRFILAILVGYRSLLAKNTGLECGDPPHEILTTAVENQQRGIERINVKVLRIAYANASHSLLACRCIAVIFANSESRKGT